MAKSDLKCFSPSSLPGWEAGGKYPFLPWSLFSRRRETTVAPWLETILPSGRIVHAEARCRIPSERLR